MENTMAGDAVAPDLTNVASPSQTPIQVQKLGHVVYEVSDIVATTKFWTEVMGFQISDHNELGMVFLRCAQDHHSIALKPCPGRQLPPKDAGVLQVDHLAMEVASLDGLFEARSFLKQRGVPIMFEGRRGPGCNIGIEFLDPDGHMLELYWGMDQINGRKGSRPAEQFRRAASLEEAAANPLPKW